MSLRIVFIDLSLIFIINKKLLFVLTKVENCAMASAHAQRQYAYAIQESRNSCCYQDTKKHGTPS